MDVERTRLDEWLFALADMRLNGSELTVALALARFMDREKLVAWPGLVNLTDLVGCDMSKIKRGLNGLIRRGVLARDPGGGKGNLTTFTGRFPTPEIGAAGRAARAPLSDLDGRSETGAGHSLGNAPVSSVVVPQREGEAVRKTGLQTGAETGAPTCARATVERVEQSSLSFASGGSLAAAATEPPPVRKGDPEWVLARRFLPTGEMKAKPRPTMPQVLKTRAEAIRQVVVEGRATFAEIEGRLEAWAPYWQAIGANGHHGGWTLQSWIEVMREDPARLYPHLAAAVAAMEDDAGEVLDIW